jgi:hypothetical protein
LFNTNSYFDNADVIIVDDAHAAENYIAGHWTIRIGRNEEHATLHQALCTLLAPYLSATDLTRLRGEWEDVVDRTWVDMLPVSIFQKIKPQLIEILDVHTANINLSYPWSLLRSHLDACQIYLSSQEILMRPLLPPTFSHAPFNSAKQRIFMSATLGAGGDLERLTGRKKIHRIPAPKGWDTQGVGRRFFVFPEMSLSEAEVMELRQGLMVRAGRSVVLVPSDHLETTITEQVINLIGFPVFNADDIRHRRRNLLLPRKQWQLSPIGTMGSILLAMTADCSL